MVLDEVLLRSSRGAIVETASEAYQKETATLYLA